MTGVQRVPSLGLLWRCPIWSPVYIPCLTNPCSCSGSWYPSWRWILLSPPDWTATQSLSSKYSWRCKRHPEACEFCPNGHSYNWQISLWRSVESLLLSAQNQMPMQILGNLWRRICGHFESEILSPLVHIQICLKYSAPLCIYKSARFLTEPQAKARCRTSANPEILEHPYSIQVAIHCTLCPVAANFELSHKDKQGTSITFFMN